MSDSWGRGRMREGVSGKAGKVGERGGVGGLAQMLVEGEAQVRAQMGRRGETGETGCTPEEHV